MDLEHALEIAEESRAGGYNSINNQALHFLASEVLHRASPASVPKGKALWDSVYKTLRNYRMTMMANSDGDGYPLIDAMSPEQGTVESGIEECTYLADAIYNDLLATAPTPPVSEDRKDAELLDYIQNHGATIQIVPMANRTFGFEVGGLHKSRKLSVREAIDAAMQEDKP